jgi:hypothetical protein
MVLLDYYFTAEFADGNQAAINHAKLLATLTKGLAQVADALPRIELALIFYPIDRMRRAVSEIYAIIIKFLIRAKDWLEEGKLMRAVHAVTRPSELRYNDLLEEPDIATQSATSTAIAASQAEQRDMHLTLLEVKQLIISKYNGVKLMGSWTDQNQHTSNSIQQLY